jgi:putative Mg2+ transporter-C (MgtC) family protein
MPLHDPLGWEAIGLRLAAAALIGSVLGLNRELHGKPAGVRTNALVCLGAALFTLGGIGISRETAGFNADALSRVLQGIVTGIGFLGAGVILRDAAGRQVQGLTTSATIWVAAALGIVCGAGLWRLAACGFALSLVLLVLHYPMEKLLHRENDRGDQPH